MLKKLFKKDSSKILKEIEDIKSKSDVSRSEYLARLIFKYNDRVISSAVIQALHTLATEHPTKPVILPKYLINPRLQGGFCMYVLDVFGVKGKGTCVSGIVSSGTLGYGNKLVLKKSDGRDIETECDDIHFFQEQDNILPGCSIGIFLKGISMGEVSQGDAVCGM